MFSKNAIPGSGIKASSIGKVFSVPHTKTISISRSRQDMTEDTEKSSSPTRGEDFNRPSSFHKTESLGF